MSLKGLKGRNINNFKKRKEPDLRDSLDNLLDNRLLQFAYRTSTGIVRTIYHMACMVVILIVIGLVLSWFYS